MFIRSLFLSPEGDPAHPALERKPSGIVDRYIAKHGSAEAALAVLAQDNIALETAAQSHATALSTLQKQIPAVGAIVLTGDDAKAYEAFKKLNLAPEKLTEALTERDTLKGTVAAAERAVQARAAAVAAGLDPEAFIDHVGTKGLVFEMRDAQVVDKGKTVTKKMPFVRPGNDEKAPFVAAAEYVGKLPAHEQRALAATSPTPAAPAAHDSRPTPTTPSSGGDKAGDFLTKLNERAASRPNPLLHRPAQQPAAATT